MSIQETGTCSLCGGPYIRWGNNPHPLRPVEDRCCDKCNDTKVVPARIRQIQTGVKPTITGKVVKFDPKN